MISPVLSHYRILEPLGAGGMGVVYRARDEQLDRDVAIKVLPEGMLSDDNARRRFRREAMSLAKLNHPNVGSIYEFGSQDGVDFLVMELVGGVGLDSKLAAGALPENEVLRLGSQLADGLAAAHAQGVVHRDLKPGNLRLTSDSRLKILDFGLAQWVESDPGARTLTMSSTQTVSGTLPYMSPEQLRGQTIDERSDIYSAGAVLYEMATGRRPFPEKGGPPLISAILERTPPTAGSVNPRITPMLDTIIAKAMDKDPARRYQSSRELRIDLERLSTGATPVSRRAGHRWVWAAAVAALVVAAAFLENIGGWRDRLLHRPATPTSSAAAPVLSRRAVAVLGFKNISGHPEDDWLSTAMEEMLTTELGAGGKLRTVPGENVVRMKVDLSLADADSYGRETLAHIRQRLGSDLVVLGSYFVSGKTLRVDFRVQDTTAGEIIDSFSDTGKKEDLLALISRTGQRLRDKLGLGEADPEEPAAMRASLPSNPEAARLYAEGLAKLRSYENLQARDLLQKAVAMDPAFAPAHSALAAAWQGLGYDLKAQEEAKKAFDLSANLSREEKLAIEARYRDANHEWAKAIEIYRTLWSFFPDDLEYGIRLANAQSMSGGGKEALQTLDQMRQLTAPVRDDPRIDVTEAIIAETQGDFHRELSAAERAASKAQQQGARQLLARAQLSQAGAYQDLGQPDKAVAALQSAQQTYAQIGDQQGVARALNQLGIVLRHQGKLEDAQKAVEESLSMSRRQGNNRGMANALNNLGNIVSDKGDLAASVPLYEQAVELNRQAGAETSSAIGLNNIGGILTQLGKLDDAGKKYEESLRLGQEVGDKDSIAHALVNLADLRSRQGDVVSARQAAEQAIAVADQTGDQDVAAYAHYTLGSVLFAAGDLTGARNQHEHALALRQKAGEKITAAESRLAIGEIDLEENAAAKAETAARETAEVFKSENVTDDQALSLTLLARALAVQGRSADSQSAIAQAHTLAAKTQDPSIALWINLYAARVSYLEAVARKQPDPDAGKLVESVIAQAGKYGYFEIQFEARLLQGGLEKLHSPAAGRTKLLTLERDARAKGLLLIAQKAARESS